MWRLLEIFEVMLVQTLNHGVCARARACAEFLRKQAGWLLTELLVSVQTTFSSEP